MDALVRRHITSYGPSSRRTSPGGPGSVCASWTRVWSAWRDEDLTETTGPDGRAYHDLADPPPPIELAGARLLPEFDALLCGYDPKARERFVAPEHYRRLWFQANGMLLAPLLLDGRLSGYWRVPGSGSSRPCEVSYFAGTRRPTKSELAEPVAALEAAYGIKVTKVSITRE